MINLRLLSALLIPASFFLSGAFDLLPAQPRPAVQDMEYARPDDSTALLLDIYLPEGVARPYPVIVWIHGGGWRSGGKGPGRWTFMLGREYAIVSITYRLTDRAIFPAQIHDCKGAIRWIRAHAGEYGFDPQRIGVFGSSAGGHLVSLLGTSGGVAELEGVVGGNPEHSSSVQAVADWYGPSNLLTIADYPSSLDHGATNSPEGLLLGGAIDENADKAWAASPIAYVSPDDPPFLIQHGTEDRSVPFHQSVELDSALYEAGVDVTFRPVVGGGHGAGFDADSVEREVIEFFGRTLLGVSGVIENNPVEEPVGSMWIGPMPAHDYLVVHFSDLGCRYRVQLANVLGEIVWEGEVVSGERIDVRVVPAGTYVLKGEVDGKRESRICVIR